MNGADLIRGCYEELLAQLVMEISDHIPGFNDGIENTNHPLRRQRQRALRLSLTGVANAIDAHNGVDVEAMDWSQHVELGRMERRYGRPLVAILRAPWAASRTIIRFINDRAAAFGLPLDAAQEAAEVVIDWSDQISIAVSEGFNDETAARAGELETHRQQLLRTVLADPASGPEILACAAAAEWRPPPAVRVLIAVGPDRQRFRRRLPAGSVAAQLAEELVALIPTQAETIPLTAHGIGDAIAALGPPAGIDGAAHSARLARRAIELAAHRGTTGSSLIDCTNHELDLVAFADRTAAGNFSQRRLGPILEKPDLVLTLDAWLANQGRPKAAAKTLGVHPNTVTYRMNQVRHHLGALVDNPQRRLELHLATHVAVHGESATPGRTPTPLARSLPDGPVSVGRVRKNDVQAQSVR